jgi:putative flippase GtrA
VIETLFEVLRFGGTGIAATLLHLLIAFAAAKAMNLSPYAANATGFASAFAVSYLGHFYWTFGRRAGHRRYLARFLVLSLSGYGLSNLIIWLVVERAGLPFVLALPWIALAVPAFTFLSAKYWAFSDNYIQSFVSNETLVLTAVLACAAVLYPQHSLNHDTSWYLIATRKWLDGATLYRDIMEINPPLAFYLTAPAVFLSKVTGADSTPIFSWMLLGCIAGSLLWVRSILDRQQDLSDPERLLLLSGFAAMMLVLPIFWFGEREHLMLVFSAPYFCAAIVRSKKATFVERISLGLFAFLGLGLKPYFLLAPLVLALVSAWRERHWRPILSIPNVALGIACIAYLSATIVLYPDYLGTVVPLGRLAYGAFGFDTVTTLTRPAVLLCVISALLWARGDRDDVSCRLAAIMAGFLLSYLIQLKGFDYQLVPVAAYLLIFCAWNAVTGPDRKAPATIGFMVTALLLIVQAVSSGTYYNPLTADFAAYAKGMEKPRILVLSSNLSAAFPFVNAVHGEWTSGYPTQWIVPGAVGKLAACEEASPDCGKTRKALAFARDSTVRDFLKGAPALVYIDVRARKPYFGGTPFDYLSWLQQDRDFAERWKNYRKIGETDRYAVWSLHPIARPSS